MPKTAKIQVALVKFRNKMLTWGWTPDGLDKLIPEINALLDIAYEEGKSFDT